MIIADRHCPAQPQLQTSVASPWAPLARSSCPQCRGAGLDAAGQPCSCVCLRIFRECHRRFRRCAAADSFARTVAYREVPRGVDRRVVWIRHNEDYCADFQAAGRRVLTPGQFRIFRLHHLLGAAADLVASRLSIARTVLYKEITDVEARVGLEFALMQPYSLYPPHCYMDSGKAV